MDETNSFKKHLGELAERWGMGSGQVERAREERRVVEESFAGASYLRVKKKFGPLERGAVIMGGVVIPEFPRIRRIVALRRGASRHVGNPFVAEEKVDGYNVRVVRAGDRLVAFTRGGHACPFTNDRLSDLLPPGRVMELLQEEGGLVLCGEVAGSGSPYNSTAPPFVEGDVRFFAFDLLRMEENGDRSVDPDVKWDLFRRYRIPAVSRIGQFDLSHDGDWERLVVAVHRLQGTGREGMVLKPLLPGAQSYKYVCPRYVLKHLASASFLISEMDDSFYMQRIFRAAFGLHELGPGPGMDLDGFLLELGRVMEKPLLEDIKKVEHGEVVREEYQVEFNRADAARDFLELLRTQGLRVQLMGMTDREGGGCRLSFSRVHAPITDRLRDVLAGAAILD